MAKSTRQVQLMVESMNRYLMANLRSDSRHLSCVLMTNMLLSADAYKGFNWFYVDTSCKDTELLKLVGSSDEAILKEKDAFIQFYI